MDNNLTKDQIDLVSAELKKASVISRNMIHYWTEGLEVLQRVDASSVLLFEKKDLGKNSHFVGYFVDVDRGWMVIKILAHDENFRKQGKAFYQISLSSLYRYNVETLTIKNYLYS